MTEKNDWRLEVGSASGREAELRNITLYRIPFVPLSEEWDHEHCIFCWEKFYLRGAGLKYGYCTGQRNSRDADWICPTCYEDFREMFGWTLGGETDV